MKIGISSKKLSVIDLSMMAYWTIRQRLLLVPGVANIAIWGERLQMLQVQVDPKRLNDNGVTLGQVMKGTADAPRCGFSARTIEVLKSLGKPFGHKDVLEDPQYRFVLSKHSSWPTIPQVFINGEFVGGCDIVLELAASGELQKLADAAFST